MPESNHTPAPRAGSAGTVIAMGGCFALGTFADNFFKQAVVLLAANQNEPLIQSVAAVLFALPYVLFSAWAGKFADALPKSRIVLAAKVTELLAIILGAISLYYICWPGVLAAIFLMGLQGTAFSPALNGSIPERFPTEKVPRVNSLIKLGSTCAVLAGIAGAGVFLDFRPGGALPDFGAIGDSPAYGRAAAGALALLVAVVGLGAALFIRRGPRPSGSLTPFPWWGPVDSTRFFLECRKDPPLFLALLAEGFFYGVSSVAVISVANFAESMGYSNTLAGLFAASLMIGIAVGAVYVGRYPAEIWRRFLVPAAMFMGLFLLLTAASVLLRDPIRLGWLFVMLFLSGMCGGIYLIPLVGFLQIRPDPKDVGKVLGVSNFFTFVFIAAWGGVFALVGLLPPAWSFVVYAVSLWSFGVFVFRPRIRHFADASLADAAAGLLGSLLKGLLALRYRVEEHGLEGIPATIPGADGRRRPILFLPNHPALIDPPILFSRLAGLNIRPLADEAQMRGLLPGLAARIFRVLTLPDVKTCGRKERGAACGAARESLSRVVEALRRGEDVLLYPAGGLSRDGSERLKANSAAARLLAEAPEARVVLVRTTGLWGSSFSRANGRNPEFGSAALRGAGKALSRGVLFMPRRTVTVEYNEPEDLPRGGDKLELNRSLEAFYNNEMPGEPDERKTNSQ